MLQRVLSATTTLGTAAIVAGVASDFVLYDGRLHSFIPCLILFLTYSSVSASLAQLMPASVQLFSTSSVVCKKPLSEKALTSESPSFRYLYDSFHTIHSEPHVNVHPNEKY